MPNFDRWCLKVFTASVLALFVAADLPAAPISRVAETYCSANVPIINEPLHFVESGRPGNNSLIFISCASNDQFEKCLTFLFLT